MTDESSSLRLTPPNYNLYETSGGEASVLRGITPENMGALYGLLLNQRSQADNARSMYGAQLDRVNAGQSLLANRKLDQDRLKLLMDTAVSLGNQGADHSNLAPLHQAGMFRSPELTAQTDTLRRQGLSAEVLSKVGAGLANASEAGVNLNPGQRVSLDPNELMRLGATTGAPRAVQVANINAAGNVAAAGASNAPRITMKQNPEFPSTYEVTAQGRGDPEALAAQFRAALAAAQRRPGASGAGGAGTPGASGGNVTATGGTNTGGGTGPVAPIRTEEQARARARTIPGATGVTTVGDRFFAIVPGKQPIPLQ